jgi:DNA-binding NtrC family response regulator
MSNTPIDQNFQTLVVDDDRLIDHLERSSPARRLAACHSDSDVVGRSQAFIEVMKQAERVANTSLPVLLTGDFGIGKALVAAAIHLRSGRAEQSFIVVNCGATPAESIEAEVFGAEDHRGVWEEADGGTIFLDGITETPLPFQIKLLHALNTGEICRADSDQTQKVNVRVIAASERNVEEEIAAGRFRNDLFYRLNAVSIALPQTNSIQTATNGDATAKEQWVPLSEIEGRYVAQVLTHTRGNKQAAARVLSIDRKTLDRMIKRHHIDSVKARRAGT